MKRTRNLDPYETTARFPSTCAESGEAIKKGAPIIYYPNGKKCYLIGSAPIAAQGFREAKALMYEEDNGFCSY